MLNGWMHGWLGHPCPTALGLAAVPTFCTLSAVPSIPAAPQTHCGKKKRCRPELAVLKRTGIAMLRGGAA